MVIKSETTKKNYDGFLRRLRAGLGAEGTAFLEDHKKVVEWIEAQTLSDNSKKAYYTAVKATLRDENKYPEAQKEYDVKFKALAEKLYEQSKKQELSPKEAEKYLKWEDILKVRDAIEPKDDMDVFKLQDWVILCLYTMMPPLRADFAPMRVYDKKPKKDEGNYLILHKNKGVLVLNEYKTRSTFGRVERTLPKALFEIIKGFRTFQPTEYLIIKEDGTPMTADNLSQRVIRIFERNTTDKKGVGISMLRHSYITYMRSGKELTLVQKEALATSMLHSTLTNELYRRPEAE